MAKKAFINTLIFTLIIVNLIIWPVLFGEMDKDDQSAIKEDTPLETVASENADDTVSDNEAAPSSEEKDHSSTEGQKSEKVFKILRIE